MDWFIVACVLSVAGFGAMYYLVLRAMVINGSNTLVFFSVLTAFGLLGLLLAYIVGWRNARRWGLWNAMWCWTAIILVQLTAIVLRFPEDSLGPMAVGLTSVALAGWAWNRNDQVWKPLRELASNPSPEAATAAARLGDLAVGPLQELLKHDDAEPRMAALAALGQIDTESARRALSEALTHDDPEVRKAAQFWLDRAAPAPA
jgi:hypothetical protein